MAFAPAGGEAALGAWTLVAALGFCVCAGLLWIWRNTIGTVFVELASYKISLKWVGGFHPLAPLGSINSAVEGELSTWADACQKQAGLAWHYMATLFWTMSHTLSQASTATLDLGHYIIHDYVPSVVKRDLGPLWNRSNKTAAAAAAAGTAAAIAKKASQSHAHTQAGAEATTKAHANQAAQTATHTGTIVKTIERTVVHDTKVITQVIEVGSIPAQFGRTVTSIRRRLGRVEALVGATAMAVAMANVLGLPNPRCLRDGPLGRVSRRLCGIPTSLLNDLLGLLADFFILENVCTMLPWIEAAASEVGTPLVELLTEVGAGLCQGSNPPAVLRGPEPSVPALIFGVSASGV